MLRLWGERTHRIKRGRALRASWFGATPMLTTGTLEILLRDWPLGHALAAEELGYRVTPLEQGVSRVLAAIEATP